MKNNQQTLRIYINGIAVGELINQKNSPLTFNYSQDWLNHPATRPLSLSMPSQYSSACENLKIT